MAKKKRARRIATAPVSALAAAPTGGGSGAAAASTTPVIDVPPGGSLTVIVDVGPMSVPYTVAYAGRTVIKSLVDRAEDIELQPGDRVLAWSFAHLVKGWHHTVGVSVNGEEPIVLESRSEADKDQDHSVNFALVRA